MNRANMEKMLSDGNLTPSQLKSVQTEIERMEERISYLEANPAQVAKDLMKR